MRKKRVLVASILLSAAVAARAQVAPINREVIPVASTNNAPCVEQYCQRTGMADLTSLGFSIVYGDAVVIPAPPPGFSVNYAEFATAAVVWHPISAYPYFYPTPAYSDFYKSLQGHAAKGFVSTSEGTTLVWWVDRV